MGGSALKRCHVRRLNRFDYEELADDVLFKLAKVVPTARLAVVPAYRNKADFGDLDILVEAEMIPDELPLVLNELFTCAELVKNGNIYSFEHREFQVDLILVPGEIFDYALGYFAWNDLGMLEGKVARQLGVKHGHRGLQLELFDGTNRFAELTLTTDLDLAVEFLGFSSSQRRSGFDELEEIFQYVADGRFFDPAIFQPERQSRASSARDRKRTSYVRFLAWLESKRPAANFTFSRVQGTGTNALSPVLLERLDHFFPAARDAIENEWWQHERRKKVKAALGGERVSRLTGLTGPELGSFIRALKGSIPNLDEVILALGGTNKVDGFIKDFYETWYKS